MAEDLGDRTEAPTSRRLSEARERGQIARSQDLSASMTLLAGVVSLVYLGGGLMRGMSNVLRHELESGALDFRLDAASLPALANQTVVRGALMLAPIVLAIALLAYAAHFLQVGWLLSTRPLVPTWSRLNVLKGLGQLASRRNVVKSIVNVIKLAVVAAVPVSIVRADMGRLVALPLLSPTAGFLFTGQLVFKLVMWLLLAMLAIGAADYLYQRWQRTEDLKMTKQEIKDERRSTEGDPDVKARRMRIARQIALQRLRSDVPKADVVVTNPTHFAVALRYDAASMRAPRVVAKGADFLAMQIRHIAASNGVPILERPALARALYHGVEVGREIPQEQYEAVAEALAYVYRLEGRMAS